MRYIKSDFSKPFSTNPNNLDADFLFKFQENKEFLDLNFMDSSKQLNTVSFRVKMPYCQVSDVRQSPHRKIRGSGGGH
jgi:hypothetical protein